MAATFNSYILGVYWKFVKIIFCYCFTIGETESI